MATSTVPAFLDALKAALDARNIAATGGGTIAVTTAASGEPVPPECIQLFRTTADQQWTLLGNRRRREQYTVYGGIYAQIAGYGEPTAKAARDRAYALLAELEQTLRADPSVGGSVRQAELLTAELDQGITRGGDDEGARFATLAFSIGVVHELVID